MSAPVDATCRPRWWVDVLWLALLAGWSAWWCLTAGARLGLTFDERLYLLAGLDGWRTSSPKMLMLNGVMPLPIDSATLPVYLHERGTGVELGDPEVTDHVGRARVVTLGWLWLLIVSAYRLGRAAGGPWAGRIGAGLVAADPTVLAHSSLATTDIAVTAALTAFTRAVYAGRGGGWWRRVVLPGLWYGVAVLCKLSALLYGGCILVALELAHRVASGDLSRPPGGSAAAWARKVVFAAARSVLAIGAVVAIGVGLAVAYCGTPARGDRPLAELAQRLPPNAPQRRALEALQHRAVNAPWAVYAFAFQWFHNYHGIPTYVDGVYYPTGTPKYFPAVLAMKTPLPVILLVLVALLRPRRAANALVLAAVLMFLPTFTAKIQNGVRLVLPVMAVAYVAVAVGVVRGWGRCGAWAGMVAVVATAATSAWVWPHGLSYLNQPSGGPAAAPDRVADSNVDWGQWLPELAAWHRANGGPPTAVWYFGMDPAADRPPLVRFDGNSPLIRDEASFRELVGPRVLAVGSTVRTLNPGETPSGGVAREYINSRRPFYRTPRFALYDFRDPAGPPPRE